MHVSNDVKLRFYDAHKLLYIEVDTSKKAIGTVMLQEDTIVINCDSNCDSKSGSEIPTSLRPISYASKTLSTTELNYSNIEHEILGLLFAAYQPGANMHLSDAISRLSTHDNSKGTTIQNLDISIHAIEELPGFNSLSVDKIQHHTVKDPLCNC